MAVNTLSEKHLRFILPVFMTLLAMALVWGGEVQIERVEERMMTMGWERDSPLREFAVEGEVGHALNAPAWGLAKHMPYLPPLRHIAFWGSELNERGILYFVFVAVMWHLVGVLLDKGISSQSLTNATASRWKHAFARTGLAALGIMLWHDAILDLQLPQVHVDWSQASIMGWGVILMVAGAFPPLSSRKRIWRVFLGSLGVVVGVYNTREAICGYLTARSLKLDLSFSLPPIIWGSILVIAGVCVLLASRRKAAVRETT